MRIFSTMLHLMHDNLSMSEAVSSGIANLALCVSNPPISEGKSASARTECVARVQKQTGHKSNPLFRVRVRSSIDVRQR